MLRPILTFCLTVAFVTSFDLQNAEAEEIVVPTERVQKTLSLDRPIVIAHRGFKMAAPENTIPAFKMALLADADLVELDYYHSKDGVPYILHDWTLDRTTNARELWGESKIAATSKTLSEVKELDAGSWFDPIYRDTKIPTLSEALDVIQAGSITLIEQKQGDPKTLISLLKDKKMLNDVVVQSFNWDFLAGCNELAPGLPLGALGPPRQPDGKPYPVEERFLNEKFLDMLQEAGATVAGWNRQVTKEAVEEAHRRGIRVWVYTINDLDLAVELLEMGVDGIISDNAAMAWKAVAIHQGKKK